MAEGARMSRLEFMIRRSARASVALAVLSVLAGSAAGAEAAGGGRG